MRRKHRPIVIRAEGPPVMPHSGVELSEQARALQTANPVGSALDEPGDTPCAVCGGAVHPGAPDSWGPWRRHPKCATLAAWEPSRIEAACRALAIPFEGDADLVRFALPCFHTVHPEPVWRDDEPLRLRLPWRHISRDGLAAAVAELPVRRADAGRALAPCEAGPCAWCGRLESLGWGSYGHTWPDGSEAPLCADCGKVYEAAGRPSPGFWSDQRAGIAQAVSSVPVMLGEEPPEGLVAFAEGDAPSDGSPWSHLPSDALEAYRWARWTAWNGRYAPAEHAAEARSRAETAEQAKRARTAAKQAEDAARADVFGFTRHDEEEVGTR